MYFSKGTVVYETEMRMEGKEYFSFSVHNLLYCLISYNKSILYKKDMEIC